MISFDELLRQYDYQFPPERIAQEPCSPRDAAKLLVYDRNTESCMHSTFHHLVEFLQPNTVLVLNETKVVPARLRVRKSTGGEVALLILEHHGHQVRALAPKKLRPGELLSITNNLHFTVVRHDGQAWVLSSNVPSSKFSAMLDRHGSMPLPPYIKDTPLTPRQQREQYQTVFAKHPGSIAAPTASLHFTDRLLNALHERGIRFVKVTLHVHLGTFAPLTEEQWKAQQLHEETYAISPAAVAQLERAKRQGNPIIAVGTTVVRALESAVDAKGRISKPRGRTRLFLHPEHPPRFVDGLITNFHVPKSSLMMLVAAFTGREALLNIYREAIEEKYRLFSFGDGMLVL